MAAWFYRVEFVVDKAALWQVISEYLFPLPLIPPTAAFSSSSSSNIRGLVE
jgi:hypothetical protein